MGFLSFMYRQYNVQVLPYIHCGGVFFTYFFWIIDKGGDPISVVGCPQWKKEKKEKKELNTFDESTKNQQYVGYYQAQFCYIMSYYTTVQTENTNQEQYNGNNQCCSLWRLGFHRYERKGTVIKIWMAGTDESISLHWYLITV